PPSSGPPPSSSSGPPLASCQEQPSDYRRDYHHRRRSALSTASTPGAPRPTPEECESLLRSAPSHDADGSGGLSPQEYSDFLLSRGNDGGGGGGKSQHVDEYGLPTVDFLLRLVGSYNDLACGGRRCGGGEELELDGLVGGDERGERLCGEVYEVLMLGGESQAQAEPSPGGGSTLFDHSSEETGEEIEGGGEAPESEDTAAAADAAATAEDPQQASVGTQAGDDGPTDAAEVLVRERFDLDVVGSLVDYSRVDPSSSRFGTDHGLSLYLGRHRGDSPLYDMRDAILSHIVSCIGYLAAEGAGGDEEVALAEGKRGRLLRRRRDDGADGLFRRALREGDGTISVTDVPCPSGLSYAPPGGTAYGGGERGRAVPVREEGVPRHAREGTGRAGGRGRLQVRVGRGGGGGPGSPAGVKSTDGGGSGGDEGLSPGIIALVVVASVFGLVFLLVAPRLLRRKEDREEDGAVAAKGVPLGEENGAVAAEGARRGQGKDGGGAAVPASPSLLPPTTPPKPSGRSIHEEDEGNLTPDGRPLSEILLDDMDFKVTSFDEDQDKSDFRISIPDPAKKLIKDRLKEMLTAVEYCGFTLFLEPALEGNECVAASFGCS
ncbi:hypothetical protein THAOC_10799, partial [Thalassiosira oceanica]